MDQLFADSADYAAIRNRGKSRGAKLPRVRSLTPPAADHVYLKANVSVAFIVDEQGRVTDARILESSDSRLDKDSVAAVRKWTYFPGSIGGSPAKFLLVVPLQYAGLRR